MITLFVRPRHDDVVTYLHHFSDELVKISDSKGFKTLNKEKDNATKAIVTSVISKNEPNFIMFNGHGNDQCICGHHDEVIIELDKNHNLLKKRITYALSCSSALRLGKKVGDDKTAYIGYEDDFALGMDTNCQASIKKDKIAKFFLEPSNILVEAILKGNSVNEAMKKAKELMKSNISKLRTADPFLDATDYIPYLYNNYLFLEAHGNINLKLNV